MSAPVDAALDQLTPAAEDGWRVLLELADTDSGNWLLIGGQMVYLLAIENGVPPIRATDDVDIALDVRAKPGATECLADWLVERGFELESVSTDGIGHRFIRAAEPGPGHVMIDILAPDGVGARTTLFTRKPARTVSAPGTTQAFTRSDLVTVSVAGNAGRAPRIGRVRRPNVLGALIAKAAATTIAVRRNPGRDYEDAALLLSLINDPLEARGTCERSDLKKLRRLHALNDAKHPAWRLLDARAAERGRDSLEFLID